MIAVANGSTSFNKFRNRCGNAFTKLSLSRWGKSISPVNLGILVSANLFCPSSRNHKIRLTLARSLIRAVIIHLRLFSSALNNAAFVYYASEIIRIGRNLILSLDTYFFRLIGSPRVLRAHETDLRVLPL